MSNVDLARPVLAAPRRIVTGHGLSSRSCVVFDNAPPNTVQLSHRPGTALHEIWSTAATPDADRQRAQPYARPLQPPVHGTRVRIVDIPPDPEEFKSEVAMRMQDAFGAMGDARASPVTPDSPHPLMHRTELVNCGVVLAGVITMVLDEGEVELAAGDVVVQRGTHAWANRSTAVCRMLFGLVDGSFSGGVR